MRIQCHAVIGIGIAFLLLAAGCAGLEPPQPASPTLESSPAPTATPTPTAMPVVSRGNLRAAALSTPEPEEGVPCGVIDLLDFPIDPPDAEDVARGGGDFGVYRSRYEGYHAGEDWGAPGAQASFRTPVYSIGHGVVTYAAPLGWGADQGVVIVRHTAADGATFLSFYGHLDPPSVTLNVGDCVERGDRVGRIGRPRSGPHLHFEIRTHMPDTPGPGYWWRDPTRDGWLSPSQTIWNYRVAAIPGVEWTRPPAARGTRGLGVLGEDTFVAVENGHLAGIDAQDGGLRWTYTPTVRLGTSVLDAVEPVLYVRNQTGAVEALRWASDMEGAGQPALTSLWEMQTDLLGMVTMMPLPDGGMAAVGRNGMLGLASEGSVLWESDSGLPVFDWALGDRRLVVSTTNLDGAVFSIDRTGPVTLTTEVGGHLAFFGDLVWIYDDEGIYRLSIETLILEQVYALPSAILNVGDMVALPDGSLLVAHTDRYDKRLIALNADGTLRWERSYAEAVQGRQQELLVVAGQPYLLSSYYERSARGLEIWGVDVESAELTLVFDGGTRGMLSEGTWVQATGADRLLINIGKGIMCSLNLPAALEAAAQLD